MYKFEGNKDILKQTSKLFLHNSCSDFFFQEGKKQRDIWQMVRDC